jgi:hypothetical protein
VEKTSWGAPIEPNSSDKAAHYLKNYQTVIAAHPDRIIGSYAFLWGQKQERTPTWYGMFLADGTATEAVDVMHYVWNGAWPENRSPQIENLFLDSRTSDGDVVLERGGRYEARVLANDSDGDSLTYRWVVMRESDASQVGGDREQIPDEISGLIEAADNGGAGIVAPEQAGAYRLFVYVYDGQGLRSPFTKFGVVNERSLLGQFTDQAGSGWRRGQHRAPGWRAFLQDQQLSRDAPVPDIACQWYGALDVPVKQRRADLRPPKPG